jgi:hypothetical protein
MKSLVNFPLFWKIPPDGDWLLIANGQNITKQIWLFLLNGKDFKDETPWAQIWPNRLLANPETRWRRGLNTF